MTYKSKKVLFLKGKKLISLGESITPKTVKFLSKMLRKNEIFTGRMIEYVIVLFFFLSIIFLIK